jgi:type I restriction enzyme S subunit
VNDVGHRWFGKTYSKWKVVPIREVAKLGTGHTPSRANEEYWQNCTIPWVTVEDIHRHGEWTLSPLLDTEQHISELGLENSAAVLHPKGTVMLSRTASIGLSCITGRDMATTQAFVTWSPDEQSVNGDYLHAALKVMTDQYFFLAYGATHLTIYFPDIKTLRIPLPSLHDQRLIVEFLSRETEKIEALMIEQQRLIELLKEKRQAVISHVVTKGLNPNAPMKPSGVDWIGDVPAHWHVQRLKYISPQVTVGIVVEPSKLYVVEGVPALRSLNVVPDAIIPENMVFISAEANEIHKKSQLRAGDLVAVRSGQPGTTAVIPSSLDGCNCIDLIIIRKPTDCSEQFLCWYLGSDAAAFQFSVGSGGAIQQHFNVRTAMNLVVPVPPKSEQESISRSIAAKASGLDDLIMEAQRAIVLLQERRAALISGAVTGRIDVRNLSESEAA